MKAIVGLLRWLLEYEFNYINNSLETIMGDLVNVHATLQKNTEKIVRIAADQATLQRLIEQLRAQLPNNQLVQDIANLANEQATALQAIDEQVPEEQPEEPGPEEPIEEPEEPGEEPPPEPLGR